MQRVLGMSVGELCDLEQVIQTPGTCLVRSRREVIRGHGSAGRVFWKIFFVAMNRHPPLAGSHQGRVRDRCEGTHGPS